MHLSFYCRHDPCIVIASCVSVLVINSTAFLEIMSYFQSINHLTSATIPELATTGVLLFFGLGCGFGSECGRITALAGISLKECFVFFLGFDEGFFEKVGI